jgi:UDP-glucuronate 4-epimerase
MTALHVIVTGAAGFIGSHTCEALVRRGHRVTGIDAFDDFLYPNAIKRRNAADVTRALAGQAFELVEADIRDEAAMARLCGADDVDVVCHLAALAGVRPSLAEPLRYVDTNVRGTITILEAMRRSRGRRLVFASSSSVYGAKRAERLEDVAAFREDDPCLEPASPYAATKRAGELVCWTYRDRYGIGISSLRFFTVYGPRQRPDMAIHKFIDAIASGHRITMFGDGHSRRDYTFVADIVAGVVAACERVTPGRYTVYNLGNTRTVGLAELIERIEAVLGRRAVIDHQPDQPGDVPVTFADITNAQRDLAYRPTTDIEAGLRTFWAWYRERAGT